MTDIAAKVNVSLLCVVIGSCLWIIFAIRFCYFLYKYEIHIRKNYPERVKDLTILMTLNGFRRARNMLRKIDLKDAELIRLRAEVEVGIIILILLFLLIGFFISLLTSRL